MYNVTNAHKCVSPVEQAFQKGNLKPLQICVDCILAKNEKSDFVRNPLAAARVKRLLNQEESTSLGEERVQKAVKLLDSGSLSFGPELINAVLTRPDHVQDAVVRSLNSGYTLDLKGFTQDQLVDVLRFALETGDRNLFEKISRNLFDNSTIQPDGNAVVIVPQLLPVYLENSSRGAFLRDHCHGIMLGKQCPEIELLLRYLPQSLRPHMNTFWIDASDVKKRMTDIRETLSFVGPVRRLVIHGSSISNNAKEIKELLALLPDVKELVFDKVIWSEGHVFCSYDHIPQEYYEMLKKYTVSLRDVNIMGEEAVENLGKIVKLPEKAGTNWRDVTVVQEAMETEEGNTEPVVPLDRVMNSTLLSYFCPEIIHEIETGVTWPLDLILKYVSNEICYNAIKIPELRPLLFKHAEKGFAEGTIKHETINKLVSNARGLNNYRDHQDVNWFAHTQCETLVLSKGLEWVALPTLPLMVETGSPNPLGKFMNKDCGCEISVSPAVLQALGSWLRSTNTSINITGQDLLDLDLLATQLGLLKIREKYTREALQGLDEGQIQQFLDRVPEGDRINFIQTACSNYPKIYNNALYFDPSKLLKHVKKRSHWGDRLQEKLRGVWLSSYDNDKLVRLVSSPEALDCIREIYVTHTEESLFVLPTLAECCEQLERVVINTWDALTQDKMKELARLSGNFTLLLDSVTLVVDKIEARWTDLEIDEDLSIVFRNVKMKIGKKEEAFLLDVDSPYLEGASVKLICDDSK